MPSRLDRIISLMFEFHRALHRSARNRAGAPNAFSFLKLRTLRFIVEDKPLMKDLARHLFITPPSATALVERLAAIGLITRRADAHDRRNVRLALTPKGKRALEQGFRMAARRMKSVFHALNEREQQNLIHILEKMITSQNAHA